MLQHHTENSLYVEKKNAKIHCIKNNLMEKQIIYFPRGGGRGRKRKGEGPFLPTFPTLSSRGLNTQATTSSLWLLCRLTTQWELSITVYHSSQSWKARHDQPASQAFPCGLGAKNEERESNGASTRAGWHSFHFSCGQNRESRSSVVLCSETKRKRLLRRLPLKWINDHHHH